MGYTGKEEELIALCRRLIQIPSYSGQEQAIGTYIQTYLLAHGFDSAEIDEYGNVIGRLKGKRPGKRILFDGHIDTVPAENKADWHHNPFGAEIDNGRIYGRGAADMKGADAAFLFAAGEFAAAHGHDFAGEICVAGVVHEECFEGIAARKISKAVQPDLVIIGEASEMNLKYSQRGRAEIVLETFGVPCHSSNPEKGVNAVYGACRLIQRFRDLPPLRSKKMAGPGIMVLTDIKSEPYPGASVVPHYCRATFDRRLLVGETRESVLEPLQRILAEEKDKDPTLKASVSFSRGEETCYTGAVIAADRFFPGWLGEEDDQVLQSIYHAVCDKGFHPRLTGYSFCTNGSHYAGEAGIPCIGIGPGREDLAHTVDEFVEIRQLLDIARYYTAVMETVTPPKNKE